MPWGLTVTVAVGGLVAMGFLDEDRVIVGSHDGTGVFSAVTGERLERERIEDYGWYQGDPAWIRRTESGETRLVPAAGLWGGSLARRTDDGWECAVSPSGAMISAPGERAVSVEDPEELRACGFSPGGRLFAVATSSTLHLLSRAHAPG